MANVLIKRLVFRKTIEENIAVYNAFVDAGKPRGLGGTMGNWRLDRCWLRRARA